MAVAALVIALLAAVAAGVAAWHAAAQANATKRAARAGEVSAEASQRSAEASQRSAEASQRSAEASQRSAEASERAAEASERRAEASARIAAPDQDRDVEPTGEAVSRPQSTEGRLRLRSSSDGRVRRLILENVSSVVVTDVACEVVAVVGDAKPLPRIRAFGAAELHLGEGASSDPFDPTVGWPRIVECRVTWSDGLGRHDELMDVNVLQG
jgi:hypothetical protein